MKKPVFYENYHVEAGSELMPNNELIPHTRAHAFRFSPDRRKLESGDENRRKMEKL